MPLGSYAGGYAPPDPQPQSAQVRFMRTLLVSADLTADSISATGGNRRFVLRKGVPPLHPFRPMLRERAMFIGSGSRLKDTKYSGLLAQ